MTIRQTITPCLWFGGKAEEAAEFDVFPDSRITDVTALRAAHGKR